MTTTETPQITKRVAAKVWAIAAAAALGAAVLVPAAPALADPATLELVKAPVIEGAVYRGGTLTVTNPQWTVGGVTHTYLWLVDGEPATKYDSGGDPATERKYVVNAGVGSTISVEVTASKSGYESKTLTVTRPQKVREPRIKNLKVPTIKGTVAVGRTVKATPGAWYEEPYSGAVAAIYKASRYTWLIDGERVEVAYDSNSFVVPPEAKGKKLSVRVAVPLTVKVGRATSAETRVAYGTIKPRSVSIEGTAAEGQTLAAHSRWKTEGVRLSYRWTVDGALVSRDRRYVVATADKGKKVAVRVTATKPGYRTARVTAKGGTVAS